MLIWAIIATLAAILILILFSAYRRQVRKTCRLLAFLNTYETNLRLTGNLPFPELNLLTDNINKVLDSSHEVMNASLRNENSLKETITSLSHDIRTPLTSLDGYFQLLAMSSSEEERKHYNEIIQSRIASLEDILEELFTYAKLQNEIYELELSETDFGKCVFDTLFSFYDDFQRKGIEPQTEFCEERITINGNSEALKRILQNIIKNSLEHGTARIALSLSVQNSYAVFRCSNDIENPDEIDMNRVFNQFYKADSARTRTSTGLGLSIAKGLTEKTGGTIKAELNGPDFIVEIRFPLFPL